MNNTTLAGTVIGIVVVGGLVYYATVAGTPPLTTNATTTPETAIIIKDTPRVQEAGAPIVTTSPNVTTSEFAASLSGTVTPHGFFTNYWFEYGLTSNLGSKTVMQNVGSGYSTITSPGYISGLAKNTTYYYRLVAENQYGKVTGSQFTFRTNPGNPVQVGSLPTIRTLTGSGISRTSATLNGEVTPNQSTTQYWFEYGKTSDLGHTSSFQTVSDSSSRTQVSFAVDSLDPASTYYFRLNAQNGWGTVNGTTVSFKTAGPVDTSKPGADTTSASAIKTSSATLRGQVNPNGVETIYWFEYSTNSLLGSVLLKSTAHVSAGKGTVFASFDTPVSSLASNTTYFYRIVAENNLGITYGDRVAFKTK